MTDSTRSLLLFSAGCLAATLIVISVILHDFGKEFGGHPLELTSEERAPGPRRQRTFQTEMRLRIASQEELELTSPVKEVIALSIIRRNPCEIMIPEGWTIEYDSSTGRARWTDRGQEDVLAHEILHCLRGAWHDDWGKINAARR